MERERFAQCVVPEVLDEAFPPDLPSIRHVSINSIAAGELKRRRGLKSTVIPNVFDFDQPRPRRAPGIRGRLRRELGMNEHGLLVVQPTRVVPRKGIELAIELVGRLGDPDAVLLITSPAGDEGLDYLVALERLAEHHKVRLAYAADRFAPDHEGKPLRPAHSLHDAYLAADLITYPSLYEGFGNALLEALYYGVPVLVNRYPVFVADIKPLGLKLVEIDGAVTDETVEEVRSLLANTEKQRAWARHNFEIAHKHLSYRVLRAQARRADARPRSGVTEPQSPDDDVRARRASTSIQPWRRASPFSAQSCVTRTSVPPSTGSKSMLTSSGSAARSSSSQIHVMRIDVGASSATNSPRTPMPVAADRISYAPPVRPSTA